MSNPLIFVSKQFVAKYAQTQDKSFISLARSFTNKSTTN